MMNPLWSSLTLFLAGSAASAPFVFFWGDALGLTALVFAALGVGLGVAALLPMISTMGMGLSMHQQQHHKLMLGIQLRTKMLHPHWSIYNAQCCAKLLKGAPQGIARKVQANGWMAAWQPLPALPRMNDLGANRFGIIMELVGQGMC